MFVCVTMLTSFLLGGDANICEIITNASATIILWQFHSHGWVEVCEASLETSLYLMGKGSGSSSTWASALSWCLVSEHFPLCCLFSRSLEEQNYFWVLSVSVSFCWNLVTETKWGWQHMLLYQWEFYQYCWFCRKLHKTYKMPEYR